MPIKAIYKLSETISKAELKKKADSNETVNLKFVYDTLREFCPQCLKDLGIESEKQFIIKYTAKSEVPDLTSDVLDLTNDFINKDITDFIDLIRPLRHQKVTIKIVLNLDELQNIKDSKYKPRQLKGVQEQYSRYITFDCQMIGKYPLIKYVPFFADLPNVEQSNIPFTQIK